MPRKRRQKDRAERREEALRPCRYLGYDRDALALHLLSCEAFEIAEAQFRRAIWLNPFEPRFKAHLAWCLYRQGRHADALRCLGEIDESATDANTRALLRRIEESAAGGARLGGSG